MTLVICTLQVVATENGYSYSRVQINVMMHFCYLHSWTRSVTVRWARRIIEWFRKFQKNWCFAYASVSCCCCWFL